MTEPIQLTTLEREALVRSISGTGRFHKRLEQQIATLQVMDREFTGAGFFTKFACDPGLRILDLPPEVYNAPPSVSALHPQVQGGIDFIVWIKDGLIDCLEAASTTTWPDRIADITFIDGSERPTTKSERSE